MIQFAQIIFILSVLVILHEFGHYITAKMFKMRVEKFYLFMDAGFALVKKKIGETSAAPGQAPRRGWPRTGSRSPGHPSTTSGPRAAGSP